MDREPAKSFQDLIVWQKAHQFVLLVYELSKDFPKSEVYGLTSQLRRAAVSIAANIAEGFKKRSLTDKLRFLNIAQGSLEECQYYLILVEDLQYAETKELSMLLAEVSKILEVYCNSIKEKRNS
jgi:four helix bundle protein